MRWFQKILVVLEEGHLPENLLNEIAPLVKSNESEITFLLLEPHIPEEFEEMQDKYNKTLEQGIREEMAKYDLDAPVDFVHENQKPYLISIVKRVINFDYDLVIKHANDDSSGRRKGFKSLEMNLLRKCPCPVWITRGEDSVENKSSMLVAIDPLEAEKEGQDLSVKLLKMAKSLSADLGAELHVISCWELEYERYLRHSAFGRVDAPVVDAMIEDLEKRHKQAFEDQLQKADIDQPAQKALIRGKAEDKIPAYIDEKNIDLIVMGTVGRVGIPGFFIGNTAENILQNVTCEMFAVKPSGFTSPIK